MQETDTSRTTDQSVTLWVAFALMLIALVLAGTNALLPALLAFAAAVGAFVVWRVQGAPSPFGDGRT